MGIDPLTLSALITGGADIGKSLFAPQGQKFSSFQGHPSLDPGATLGEAKNNLEAVFGPAFARMLDAPDLSHAYVQDLPTFTGGGLPMPIGVTGKWGKNQPTGTGTTGGARTDRRFDHTDPKVRSLLDDNGAGSTVAGGLTGALDGAGTVIDPGKIPPGAFDFLDPSMGGDVNSPAPTGPVRKPLSQPKSLLAPQTSQRAQGAASLLLHLANEQAGGAA